MEALELQPIRNEIVGSVGMGLSNEQLKRLTIAVEVGRVVCSSSICL